jgi:hypothetical protein
MSVKDCTGFKPLPMFRSTNPDKGQFGLFPSNQPHSSNKPAFQQTLTSIPLMLFMENRKSTTPTTKLIPSLVFLFGVLFSVASVWSQDNGNSSARTTASLDPAKTSHTHSSRSRNIRFGVEPTQAVGSPQALDETRGGHEVLSSPTEPESATMGRLSKSQKGNKRAASS